MKCSFSRTDWRLLSLFVFTVLSYCYSILLSSNGCQIRVRSAQRRVYFLHGRIYQDYLRRNRRFWLRL